MNLPESWTWKIYPFRSEDKTWVLSGNDLLGTSCALTRAQVWEQRKKVGWFRSKIVYCWTTYLNERPGNEADTLELAQVAAEAELRELLTPASARPPG